MATMRTTTLSLLACLLALTAAADNHTLTRGEYWTDDNHNSRSTVTIGNDGLMQFVLDASTLREGLHMLHYRVLDDTKSSPVQTWAFFRGRLGSEIAKKVVEYEYWTDDRYDLKTTKQMETGGVVQFGFDASSLAEGLHTLHYRVKDDQNRYSPAQAWMFYRYMPTASGASTLEYWIDEDGEHQTLAIGNKENTFVVDASAVDEGLHTLHYQLNTLPGQPGAVRTWLFFRVAPSYDGGARTLEYWVDDGEHTTRTVAETDVAFTLDASALDEGLHTLYYQLKEDGGRVSAQQSWLFYRIAPKLTGANISFCRIWWNDYQDKAVDVKLPDGHTEYLYQELLTMPEYVKNDGYSRNNTATVNFLFCDDRGSFSPMVSAEVGYPDVYPPVTTLTATKSADGIALSWKSNEDTVRDWNVYYSENNEPYVLWKSNVKEQTATFCGQQGATYKFIVTARDVNGNYEAIDESRAVKVTLYE